MPNKELWRDASQRLTFDLPDIVAADYAAICNALVTAFSLVQETPLVVGFDSMFWDYRRGEQVISLDWDIWMGFMVVAKTIASEPLVEEIAKWLSESSWARSPESQR